MEFDYTLGLWYNNYKRGGMPIFNFFFVLFSLPGRGEIPPLFFVCVAVFFSQKLIGGKYDRNHEVIIAR